MKDREEREREREEKREGGILPQYGFFAKFGDVAHIGFGSDFGDDGAARGDHPVLLHKGLAGAGAAGGASLVIHFH